VILKIQALTIITLQFLLNFDPNVAPLGIITLEDVLEGVYDIMFVLEGIMNFVAELIGEEIYDEFDTEGARHGEVTSYIPPQSILPSSDAPILKRKGSAPQLSSPEPSRAVVLPSVQPTQRRLTSGTGTPVLRPIALKGLSFLTGRSRSEPPIPRDGMSTTRPTVIVTQAGDEKRKPSVSANMHHDIDEKPVEPVSAPPLDIPAAPAPVYLPLPAAVSTTSQIDDAARVRQGVNAISGSTSPVPSLSEALLRARRPATPHASAMASTKGTRFKSTPFGVADHVLRLGETQIQSSDDLKRDNVQVGARSGAGVQGEE
jgi:metal transporter CNNM